MAARDEQSNDALTLPRPGGEQFEHPVVVDALADQGGPNEMREVIVTDADRIRVAV
jgi:hypothetical protein